MTPPTPPTSGPGTAVAWRRDLHAHPEVGFTEFRTASRVAGRLADLGWHVRAGTDDVGKHPQDRSVLVTTRQATLPGVDPPGTTMEDHFR